MKRLKILPQPAKLNAQTEIIMDTAKVNRRPSTRAELLNVVLGAALALSPFILGFSRPISKWNDLAAGSALVVVALLGWAKEDFKGLVMPLCVWVFASPFLLGFSSAAFLVTNVLMAFAILAAFAFSDALRLPKA
jgi:hypothetical protein